MHSDEFVVEPSSVEPIYRQIAQQLRRLIVSGRLPPGAEIPSVRDVAGRHAINPMTVSRAYGQLEAEGFLERRRGRGMAVAAVAGKAQTTEQRLKELQPRLEELVRQARELGLANEIVIRTLGALFEADL